MNHNDFPELTFELTIELLADQLDPAKHLDLICQWFDTHGINDYVCSAYALEDVSPDTPFTLNLYHFDRSYLESLAAHINREILSPPLKISINQIATSAWNSPWEEDFHSFSSTHFEVLDPQSTPQHPDKIPVFIQQKNAFGTGAHVTTKLCLMAMDNIFASGALKSKGSFLDVGCGTGVLAIAAAKYGFSEVVATEIDPEGIRETKENAKINQVSLRLFDTPDIPQGSFDLVVSNILPPALNQLLPEMSSRVNENGQMILAGFTQKDEKSISEIVKSEGLHCSSRIELNGWLGLTFRRFP